jgi:hypothetical protein
MIAESKLARILPPPEDEPGPMRAAVYEHRGALTTAAGATGEVLEIGGDVPEFLGSGKWVRVVPFGGLWQVVETEC